MIDFCKLFWYYYNQKLTKKSEIDNKGDENLKGCYTIYDEFYTPDGEVLEICVVKGGFAVRTNNRFCFFNPSLKGCKDFVYTYIITSAQNILWKEWLYV